MKIILDSLFVPCMYLCVCILHLFFFSLIFFIYLFFNHLIRYSTHVFDTATCFRTCLESYHSEKRISWQIQLEWRIFAVSRRQHFISGKARRQRRARIQISRICGEYCVNTTIKKMYVTVHMQYICICTHYYLLSCFSSRPWFTIIYRVLSESYFYECLCLHELYVHRGVHGICACVCVWVICDQRVILVGVRKLNVEVKGLTKLFISPNIMM